MPVIRAGEWDAPIDKTDGEAQGEPEHKVGYIIFIWQRGPGSARKGIIGLGLYRTCVT